ncbi:MAG: PH domain-containing protein [Pseudobdellovibrionaceae bacterium]
MLYVQQSLAPDEELLYVGKFHWFYDVQAVMNLVWGVVFAISLLVAFATLSYELPENMSEYLIVGEIEEGDGWLVIVRKLHPAIKLFSLLIFLMGIVKFAQMIVIKVTTEIVVTNNRIIYKRGLVARNIGEMSIDRIESISVTQSIWGRIFDFGQLFIHGMGVGELRLPNLAEPLKFRRALEKARSG